MSSQPFNPFDMLTTPWGKLPLGGGATPSSTIEELDKRITELKTVEQWLSLNLSLLKTTIQGLEVQRGTLAAIQAFSGSFNQKPDSAKDLTPGAAKNPFSPLPQDGSNAPAGMEQAAWWWNSMQEQFGQMLAATQASAQAITNPAPADKATKKPSDKAFEKPSDKPLGSKKS